MSYTAQEESNMALVLALRAAPHAERGRFMHPNLRHHRRGFAFLNDLVPNGYNGQSVSDRVDTVEDIIAKDDRVWAVWTLRGHHTGTLFGIPATGRSLEVTEMGIWRIQDGLVAEAWFFGDELTLLRQLGLPVTTDTLAPLHPDTAAR
ncbi:ester cyclase [Actinocrispum wychmicini]|uniref:Putative ester cyclase n=1 Tax=Actinocrispum wychmicini TaxID=1213861 RepID=A0A4R2K8P4_9PSEU|nr:ester cyclase [Actinocrispum wychmicini]TCO62755.1 putative ester cyclase [Actinocrispum wychmicini]